MMINNDMDIEKAYDCRLHSHALYQSQTAIPLKKPSHAMFARSAGRLIYLYIDQITIFQNSNLSNKMYATNESPFRFIFPRPINDTTFPIQRSKAKQTQKIRKQSEK